MWVAERMSDEEWPATVVISKAGTGARVETYTGPDKPSLLRALSFRSGGNASEFSAV
jgi:hypothetical protein